MDDDELGDNSQMMSGSASRSDVDEIMSGMIPHPSRRELIAARNVLEKTAPDERLLAALVGRPGEVWLATPTRILVVQYGPRKHWEYEEVAIEGCQIGFVDRSSSSSIVVIKKGNPDRRFQMTGWNQSAARKFFAMVKGLSDPGMAKMAKEGPRIDCQIPESVLVGVTGLTALRAGEAYIFRFAPDRLLVEQYGAPVTVLSVEDLLELKIDGPGLVKSGGHFFGGGSGYEGALEGMLAAAVLNKLTAKAKIETYVSIRTRTGSAILFCSSRTPRELMIDLTPALHRVESVRQQTTPVSLADQFATLAKLRTDGHLTDDEFMLAKRRILEAHE